MAPAALHSAPPSERSLDGIAATTLPPAPSAAAASADSQALGNAATQERRARAQRQRAQGEALRGVLAQPGWQALIAKSSKMFDTLSREFCGALRELARLPGGGSFEPLLMRLEGQGGGV